MIVTHAFWVRVPACERCLMLVTFECLNSVWAFSIIGSALVLQTSLCGFKSRDVHFV
jgi:hypothetical protein